MKKFVLASTILVSLGLALPGMAQVTTDTTTDTDNTAASAAASADASATVSSAAVSSAASSRPILTETSTLTGSAASVESQVVASSVPASPQSSVPAIPATGEEEDTRLLPQMSEQLMPEQLSCIKDATWNRENAILDARGRYQSSINSVMQARRDALAAAWSAANIDDVHMQVEQAWMTASEESRGAKMQYTEDVRHAWHNYEAELQSCDDRLAPSAADNTGEDSSSVFGDDTMMFHMSILDILSSFALSEKPSLDVRY